MINSLKCLGLSPTQLLDAATALSIYKLNPDLGAFPKQAHITYPVSHEGESILVYIHPDVESAVTVRVHIASTWRAFNIGQADGLKNKCDLTTAVTVGMMLRMNVGAVQNQFP